MKKWVSVLLLIFMLFPRSAVALFSAEAETEETLCPDLCLAGGLIWRFEDGLVTCTDLYGSEKAALSASMFLSKGEHWEVPSLVSWGEDGALLCLPIFKGSSLCCVELLELAWKEDAIGLASRRDEREALGFLYERGYLEVEMVSQGGELLFTALDDDFQVELYCYVPGEDARVHSLGERELSCCRAVLPYREACVLVIEQDDFDESLLRVVSLSLEDGAAKELGRVLVGSAQDAFNFAYDPEEADLYFTVHNLLYRASLSGDKDICLAAALPAMPSKYRYGILSPPYFVCQGEDGQLLFCNGQGMASIEEIRIADTMGSELANEAISGFNLSYPDYGAASFFVGEEEDLLRSLKKDPGAYDAYVISVGSPAWDYLSENGFLFDVSGVTPLSDHASDMPSGIWEAITEEGKLLALPVSLSSLCLMANPGAIENALGLTGEEVPKDICGFLSLLKDISSQGTLTGSEDYCIFDGEPSAEVFREIVLESIIQAAALWRRAGGEDGAGFTGQLQMALSLFNEVDWMGLGLTDEDDGADFEMEMSDKTSLFANGYLDLQVEDYEEGLVYWPISFLPEADPYIPLDIGAICLNPNSPHLDAAEAFLSHLYEQMDIVLSMKLSRSLSEPVINPDYEEGMQACQEMVAELEGLIGREKDPKEKALLQEELSSLSAFLSRYEQNAYYLVSAESLRAYRSLEDDLIPMSDEFWRNTDLADMLFDFLDGYYTPEELVLSLEPFF